jgi:hypothetical protein
MISVETIPGMGRVKDEGEWWRGEFKYDIFDYYKNIFKCHNGFLPSTVIGKIMIWILQIKVIWPTDFF